MIFQLRRKGVGVKPLVCTMLLLGLILVGAQTGHAAYFSGVLLNKYCSSESPYEKGMCLGYVVGVIDSFNTTNVGRFEKFELPSWKLTSTMA